MWHRRLPPGSSGAEAWEPRTSSRSVSATGLRLQSSVPFRNTMSRLDEKGRPCFVRQSPDSASWKFFPGKKKERDEERSRGGHVSVETASNPILYLRKRRAIMTHLVAPGDAEVEGRAVLGAAGRDEEDVRQGERQPSGFGQKRWVDASKLVCQGGHLVDEGVP